MGAVDTDRNRRPGGARDNQRALHRGCAGLLVCLMSVVLLGAGPAGARVMPERADVARHSAATSWVAAAKNAVAVRRARARSRARSPLPDDLARRIRERASLRAVDLSCLASFQFDFSPKLDNNTVSSQTTAALTACLSPDGLHNDLLSAVLFADRGHSTATGCSPVPIAIDGVGSILWNDDSTSDFTFRVNTNPLAERFGLEANITGGTLAGGRITALPLLILQDGLCGFGGVNSLSVNFGFDVFTH